MSQNLEEKILNVLREADKPMRALDIGKKLGFSTRREVNKVIYKLKGVKQLNNPSGSGPPLWQLETSTDSTAAQLSSESGACGRESALVSQLGGQLSKISIGDERTATWNDGNRLLSTIEPTADGKGIILRPLSRDEVIRQGGGATTTVLTTGPSNIQATPDDDELRQDGKSKQPVQETVGYPNDIKTEPHTTGIDPINFVESIKVSKEFEKDTGDNPGKHKTECTGPQNVLPDTAREDSPSRPSASAIASKKKPKIAANFHLSSQLQKKTQILEILVEGPLDTHQVSVKLGMPTRVEAMQLLEELKHDGRVSAVERDGVSIWSIKQ